MSDKKSQRVLLRVTEEMAQTIRALAEIHRRPIQDELRFLIECGLEQNLGHTRKERPGPRRQLPATGVNSRQREGAA